MGARRRVVCRRVGGGRRCGRGGSGLAAWAPVGDPGVDPVALLGGADPGAAAAAALPTAFEDPVLTAPAQLAGGGLLRAVGVAQQELPGQRDRRGRVGQVAHRGPRRDPEQEAHLGLVEVADAGHHPLLEQHQPQLVVGPGGEPAQRLGGVPVVPAAGRAGPARGARPAGPRRRWAAAPGRAARTRPRPGRRWPARRGPRAPAAARTCPAGTGARSRPSGSGCAGCGRRRSG